MKILISGASGFIGNELYIKAKSLGYEVKKLVRNSKYDNKSEIYWSPNEKIINIKELEGFDCIINLSGENIANRPWTKSVKNKIYKSRIESTQFLVECFSKLDKPPKTFLSASAIGIYPYSLDATLDEESEVGNSFLSKVCLDWEKEANYAKALGIRVANLRFGLILSKKGGVLKKMYLPFSFGLGGKIGSGLQKISWISLSDTVRAILEITNSPNISGPVNIVNSNFITNKEFTINLAKALNRPAFFHIPEFFLKLTFINEMANELFLKSAPIKPTKLLKENFKFLEENITEFLKKEFKS